MKYRIGFISNSSSANFVAIGISVPNLANRDTLKRLFPDEDFNNIPDDKISGTFYEMLYEHFKEYSYRNNILYYNINEEELGIAFARKSYTIKELEKIGDDVKTKFNLPMDAEIKLMTGTSET